MLSSLGSLKWALAVFSLLQGLAWAAENPESNAWMVVTKLHLESDRTSQQLLVQMCQQTKITQALLKTVMDGGYVWDPDSIANSVKNIISISKALVEKKWVDEELVKKFLESIKRYRNKSELIRKAADFRYVFWWTKELTQKDQLTNYDMAKYIKQLDHDRFRLTENNLQSWNDKRRGESKAACKLSVGFDVLRFEAERDEGFEKEEEFFKFFDLLCEQPDSDWSEFLQSKHLLAASQETVLTFLSNGVDLLKAMRKTTYEYWSVSSIGAEVTRCRGDVECIKTVAKVTPALEAAKLSPACFDKLRSRGLKEHVEKKQLVDYILHLLSETGMKNTTCDTGFVDFIMEGFKAHKGPSSGNQMIQLAKAAQQNNWPMNSLLEIYERITRPPMTDEELASLFKRCSGKTIEYCDALAGIASFNGRIDNFWKDLDKQNAVLEGIIELFKASNQNGRKFVICYYFGAPGLTGTCSAQTIDALAAYEATGYYRSAQYQRIFSLICAPGKEDKAREILLEGINQNKNLDSVESDIRVMK